MNHTREYLRTLTFEEAQTLISEARRAVETGNTRPCPDILTSILLAFSQDTPSAKIDVLTAGVAIWQRRVKNGNPN